MTDIARPADNIRLGIASPGRPEQSSRPRSEGRWRKASIDED
ncbi:hypothetical protein [Krasilnikovia sp. M28-CT-15]